MAKLDETALDKLRSAIQHCDKQWILAACRVGDDAGSRAPLEGTIGFLDWRLHGQVSRLLKRGRLPAGELTLVPSQRHLGRASLLVYAAESDDDDADIAPALKKLRADDICVAIDTLPPTLATKWKKSFAKAGIQWRALGDAE